MCGKDKNWQSIGLWRIECTNGNCNDQIRLRKLKPIAHVFAYDLEKCWTVALPSRLFSGNWVFQFRNEFKLIMHILTIQCKKFTFSEIPTFCSSYRICSSFSSFFLSFLLPSVNDCNCFRSVFIDLDKALLDPHCECAWCQSEKQSIWPSITAHWMKSAMRYVCISPWNEAY